MPQKQKPKRKSAAKADGPSVATVTPKDRMPEWLTTSDPEAMYQLSFRTEQCDLDPLIDLSRSEFVALKHHLAKLRGYTVPEVTNA